MMAHIFCKKMPVYSCLFKGSYLIGCLWLLITCILRYDEGQTLVRDICPAAKFVWSSEPPDEFLCKVTSLSFDDSDSLPLKDHPLTTNEVCCA